MGEHKTSIFEYDSVREAIAYSEQKGMEKGRKIGMEKASLEIAKQCLQKGLSIELISSITGLSIERIKSIPEC
ncbi:MAG: hypothetical protein LBP50_00715 [Tannerella sp.]|jgi:predicted transposase/invertase (TIGR01784 family)|nr:hypothetical protein [Tannerella sp.]